MVFFEGFYEGFLAHAVLSSHHFEGVLFEDSDAVGVLVEKGLFFFEEGFGDLAFFADVIFEFFFEFRSGIGFSAVPEPD